MRSIFVLALIALASTVSAGSIRPAAVTTTADEDAGLKALVRNINTATCASVALPKTCTDAEAKAKNPALVIYAVSAAGYQDYSSAIYASMVHDHAKQGITLKTAKSLPDAYLAASPSVQSQVDTLLGVQ